jgi:hypothetical protein
MSPIDSAAVRAAELAHEAGVPGVAASDAHSTLEVGVAAVTEDRDAALLACVVYPALHEIVFENLDWLELAECFVLDTYNMLLARRPGSADGGVVASHPAPAVLAAPLASRGVRLVSSNAQAAVACAAGEADACVTTLEAARRHGLEVVRDFGPVPMGFTIHVHAGRDDDR